MSKVYDVIIRNDRIEWTSEPPVQASGGQPVHAQVRLLDEDAISKKERGLRMAQIMEQLAQMQDTGLPEDPAQWEREEREDRPLPGR